MANDVAATYLQKMIGRYQEDNLDKFLRLESQYGSMMAFADDTRLIDSGMGIVSGEERDKISDGGYSQNGVAIPVIQNDVITLTNNGTTTCLAQTGGGDTALVDITYNTLSFDLLLDITQMDWNYVGWDSYLGKQLQHRFIAARTALNAACLAALETNKNKQQTTENLLGFFVDSTTDEFNTTQANKDQQWNFKRALMDVINLEGFKPFRNIGNTKDYSWNVYPTFNQGAGNNTNTSWQFGEFGLNGENFSNGNDTLFYQDNAITDAAGIQGTSFMVPTGSLALISSTDIAYYEDQSKRSRVNDLANTEIFTTELPGFPAGFEFGVKHKMACNEPGGGALAREQESWQFETKYAIVTPYVEDIATENTVIQKHQVTVA